MTLATGAQVAAMVTSSARADLSGNLPPYLVPRPSSDAAVSNDSDATEESLVVMVLHTCSSEVSSSKDHNGQSSKDANSN